MKRVLLPLTETPVTERLLAAVHTPSQRRSASKRRTTTQIVGAKPSPPAA